MIDSAAVAVEIRFHQRGLLLRVLRPARPCPAVHVGLNHQRLLALLLLLLFQQCSLEKGTEKSICYWTPNSSNPPWKTVVRFTPSPALHLSQLYSGGSWQTRGWDVRLQEIFPKNHNQPTAETPSAENSK